MNKQTHSMRGPLTAGTLTTAGVFFGYLAQMHAGDVGPMAAYMPPAPVSDCDACNDPGWYGGVSLLYLKPYLDGGEGADGDWDLGARGTLGFERPDGLFYELNGFWYESEYDLEGQNNPDFSYDNDISTWYIEGLIGDNLHCGESCLDFAFGIRYANLELEESNSRVNFDGAEGNFTRIHNRDVREFEGIGPVIRLDGTRRLTDQVSLYAGVSQAILFGEEDYTDTYVDSSIDFGNPPRPTGTPSVNTNSYSRDTLAYVTELEGGVQFDFNMGAIQGAHLRVGIEGQYWSIGGSSLGLFGGVVGVGFNF